MLAPEPFFQPRGTPISIYFRLQALSALGHRVDLVTYHLGEDEDFTGLRIYRIPDLFFIRDVRIGPSLAKIPLDLLLLGRAVGRLLRERYDLIFSHEEAALFGTGLSLLYGIPHVYDMHSSLPQQLVNFKFSDSPLLGKAFLWIERFILRHSGSVIVICLDLHQRVEREGYAGKTVLLENFLDFETQDSSEQHRRQQREALGLTGKRVVLYTGNFQAYQGIPLLLEAAAHVPIKDAVFVLVGGDRESQEKLGKKVRDLGIQGKVVFTGQVPPQQIPGYVNMADVLVSPRLAGSNTPLKIYSYMKSGKPIVATSLWTHTQVLNDRLAVLTPAEPRALAAGIAWALSEPQALARAARAKGLADQIYTKTRYLEKINAVLDRAVGNQRRKRARQ